MSDFGAGLLVHQNAVRLGAFALFLVGLTLLEARFPRRRDPWRAGTRARHILLTGLDTVFVRFALPIAPVGVALYAQGEGLGIFALVDWPPALVWLVSIVVLDLAIYAQHVAMHKVALLWRLHMPHHADTAFDVTTALRFHPLEILVSTAYKCALVVALGVPAGAVILYEVVLSSAALFTHANLALPARIEPFLRRLIVTPDMHRVHHSVHRDETDSNYGNLLSLWDRLFGTYRGAPQDGQEGMAIGLADFRDPRETGSLRFMLAAPFLTRGARRAAPRGSVP